ncbi:FeoA family protein [hydrothermal vent metagenome]|uniref:FeoA family protein n=1 Tax=hydrothermal vent metagenome TaxID=652676 RepID=A0A1W1D4U4_9ZZZZ
MSVRKLSDLKEGQKAIIKEIGDIGELKQRLYELGIICKEPLEIVRVAPFGDPIQIRVENNNIAIRKEEAKKILVENLSARKKI